MFRPSSHETFDCDMRCFHHSQLPLARKKSYEFAKQKGHDTGDLVAEFCAMKTNINRKRENCGNYSTTQTL